jgi:hypothetical protein
MISALLRREPAILMLLTAAFLGCGSSSKTESEIADLARSSAMCLDMISECDRSFSGCDSKAQITPVSCDCNCMGSHSDIANDESTVDGVLQDGKSRSQFSEYVLVQELTRSAFDLDFPWEFPVRIQLHPSGVFAYVLFSGWQIDSEGQLAHGIAIMNRDPETGILSFLDMFTTPASESGFSPDPNSMAIDPAGEYLFIASRGSQAVCIPVLHIDPASGLLTLAQVADCAASELCSSGQSPGQIGPGDSLVVSPDRSHLYRGTEHCIDTFAFTPGNTPVLAYQESTTVASISASGDTSGGRVHALAISSDGDTLMALVDQYVIAMFARDPYDGSLYCKQVMGFPGAGGVRSGGVEFVAEVEGEDELYLVSSSGLPLQEYRVVSAPPWKTAQSCPFAEPTQLIPATTASLDFGAMRNLALAVTPTGNQAAIYAVSPPPDFDPMLIGADRIQQVGGWSLSSVLKLPDSLGADLYHEPIGQDTMQFSKDGKFLYVGALTSLESGDGEPVVNVYERVVSSQ